MAKINVTKEIVENHTTEEVLEYAVNALKGATRRYKEVPESPEAIGVFLSDVERVSAYLDALGKKLAPKDPVVIN